MSYNIDTTDVQNANDVTYLNVPFSKKDEAKKNGAYYDSNKKKWFTFNNSKCKNDLISNYGASV